MTFFRGEYLRYSMTASIYHERQQLYWGVRYNDLLEDWELHGDFKERGPATEFEMLDCGTTSNIPLNSRPRAPNLQDTNTQKFYLRFNETVMFRSVAINKYVGTVGHNFNAETRMVDSREVADQFRMIPQFNFNQPSANPIATNENLVDDASYIKNATKLMLLNQQNNYINKIELLPKMIAHGNGNAKKSMWRHADQFVFIMKKPFEE